MELRLLSRPRARPASIRISNDVRPSARGFRNGMGRPAAGHPGRRVRRISARPRAPSGDQGVHARGENLPSDMPSSLLHWVCGVKFDSHKPAESYDHRSHIYAVYRSFCFGRVHSMRRQLARIENSKSRIPACEQNFICSAKIQAITLSHPGLAIVHVHIFPGMAAA